MSPKGTCWCADCEFALNPFKTYAEQIQDQPGKMYYQKFMVSRASLDAQHPRDVRYMQEPYLTTARAVQAHYQQCCPVENYDLQYREDNIQGMKYIASKVPLPPVATNPELVPLPRSMYDEGNYPPTMINQYNIGKWIHNVGPRWQEE